MNHPATAFGSIIGMVATVPACVIRNADCHDPAAADEAAKVTGVRERRWVAGDTAGFLCTAAAERLLSGRHAAVSLLAGLGWSAADLDLIVYVTQTPGRAVPAEVYSIAARLGATCPCMQVNWSCSGYVYGLWTAMRMLAPGQRALLLVGDTSSQLVDPADRATAPLFGDAGSATAIMGGGPTQHFVMGTDGGGVDKLCTVPDDYQGDITLRMDGAAVFSFTLKRVPPMLADLRAHGEPDTVLMHQANRFILDHLAKKCGIEPARVPINIERFGNTSCCSIPLLVCDPAAGVTFAPGGRVAMLGYGAGLAWAGASLVVDPLLVQELIEV